MSDTRRRLDRELVRRGLATSRSEAAVLVERRHVLVGGAYAEKASRLVAADEPVELVGDLPRYVGRGGEKLAGALAEFGVAVAGRSCLDAGSSTGGFTDCLLQNGARRVVAVDVGRGQLHPRLRADARVDVREQTDIRAVVGDLTGSADVVVADLSFIGLRVVLPALCSVAGAGADVVVLVKPQFEAGAAAAGRGKGVIRDPRIWERVLVDAMEAVGEHGAAMMGAMESPLRGAAGNVEFFLHARHERSTSEFPIDAVASTLAGAVAGAPE